ncbi:titin-like isoform X2 [Nymphalis io]|uniref:titin-like isoform X2 n=1 Tax=Inachis io TaxID=171585 RepID=UPI00216713BF|nr:titin-like isoform X2 [Nymphalis io]
MGSNCCKGDAAGKPLVRSSSSIYNRSRAGAKLDDRFTRSDDAGGVRLTITAAQTGDSGVYTLQASNAAGKDTTRVRLEVSPDEMPTGEDPPTFLRRLQDLTVKVGTRTRFLVEIVSSTECSVTWYRNERRLLEAERIALVRDGNFWCADISAVSVDDAGRWTCTAENVGGRASCSAHLNVLVPKAYKRPEFVEELRALLTEQGTVSLECKVVGVPTPVLRWFKDSREIKAGDVFALTANAEDPTSLGTYTCEAVNCMGRAYSSSKVHVVGRASREGSSRPSSGGITPEPPPIFTKELEDHFVRICEPLTLSCNIVVPPWPRNVVWYNKEGKIDPSERYRVLEDGVGGYLLEVPTAEWPDEGEWKCVVTSTGGRVGISTCYVSMDVPKNYRKPRFMENLQAVLTEEGLVSFECKVVGFPTPVLSWFKDGQELKPGDVYQLTGTNSLGSYCCIARNCMGQASSSAELTVEDIQNQLNEEEKLQLFSKNQAPKFLQGLKSVEAKIDEPFRFTIKVAIPPEPTVSWYRDDQPVDESLRCHHGKEERGVFFLDIQNLEFMDQAEWKCVAMNDFGHSVTSCFLKLIIPRHYKKPRFLENLQAILSDEGAVNLECKVIGVPQPVLKWYKDGEELKPGDIHRIISGQDGTCCLGTYTCEAQNCMGIAASSASLLGFEDSMKARSKKKADEQALQRNLSLSTIHEERTSQMYDTPVGDITLDEKGEISFSFDGKEVSVSLYETPDLTEEEALQIVEMYADQLSENVTEHNVVELPPLRFVKETSTSGNLLMEAIIIDVSPEYFTSPEEDLRTEADIEDISIADENGPPQLSLDQEADGEDYLEKTIALLSDEMTDFPKKNIRKKSDSQRSVDDYFSLSRDQSLSEEKKDDDTQILSESDLQSFASAHSSGKPKSKSSKPSIEDGQESSDITKTVVLKEDLQNKVIETEPLIATPIKQRRSSRRSSSGSEKSLNKMKDKEIKTESENVLKNLDVNKENVKTVMNNTSLSLTEVINEIQILERDIILKSEFMSTAATASNSLEIINSLITPLSEIHSITDAIREMVCESSENITPLLKTLPPSLKNLQDSLTIISKCIDVESDNKTLVKKTCMSIIRNCGHQLDNIIKNLKETICNEYLFVEKIQISNIETITTNLINIIHHNIDVLKSEENKKTEKGSNLQEATIESKHLHATQKAIHELRGSLRSLLFIIEEVDICKETNFGKIRKSEIILNDMSTPIQDLQTALEQIEILSVTESNSDLQKYNTEIIEKAMESVLKLRTSFEQLSGKESNIEDKAGLSVVLYEIKTNIKEISMQLDELETKTGKFDILNSDNKLETLQKIAQILINLENNLPILESFSSIKGYMTEFHKNLTKVLENVIESNDANKYFTLLEICDAVNRMNTSIKNIESNNVLSLASIGNTLKIIHTNVSNNVFEPELNFSMLENISNLLVCIQENMNKAEELNITENLEEVKDLLLEKYEESKVKVVLENIEQTIIAIGNVISHESSTSIDFTWKKAMENICPILEDLKYCIASSNVKATEKDEKISDLESLSLSQSIANPLIDLHQNISVLNQVICENADSQEFSLLVEDYAKPLLDLRNTLEILQHDVMSQCIDNVAYPELNTSIANVVENLKSCIVMIQEQHVIEAADDMSTLEDISGIKTTADILPSDDFVTVTVNDMENVQFAEEAIPSATGQALQILKENIMTLQDSELLNCIESVEIPEYSSIKSINIRLEEISAQIESILQPITMESCQELTRYSQVVEIIQPLQEIRQHLSVIDIDNIPVCTDITESTPEKMSFIKESIQNFKSNLNDCLDILQSAIEVTDNAIDISSKINTLRRTCDKVISSLDQLEETILSNKVIIAMNVQLKETVNRFVDSIRFSDNTQQVKSAIEDLYEAVVPIKEELTYLVKQNPELLSIEDIFTQLINDIENNIISLEQCNFVNLAQFNSLKNKLSEMKVTEYHEEPNDKEETLNKHLSDLIAPLDLIYNKLQKQMLVEKKETEETGEIDSKSFEMQLSYINENINKFEKCLNLENISINGEDICLGMKVNETIHCILNSIKTTQMSESLKTILQPIEAIAKMLQRILPAENKEDKHRSLKEKAETLLQQMEHYIEIIEIVEEVSAVIKIEDLKESANIVRELQQSIVTLDPASEVLIESSSNNKIKEEQAEIVQKLHKALIMLQTQALESTQELTTTANEDIRQQIIEVVSDLQNDFIASTGNNVIVNESSTTSLPEIIQEETENNTLDEQNTQVILETDNKTFKLAAPHPMDEPENAEDIFSEPEQPIEDLRSNDQAEQHNKIGNLLTQTNIQHEQNVIYESLISQEFEEPEYEDNLTRIDKSSINEPELKEPYSKSEKLGTIKDILLENITEYISDKTMIVLSKLSHPLHCEHLKKTIELATQLWNNTKSESSSLEQTELSSFSTEQIELVLSLNEAILIMYETTFEESQELENKVGKDELDIFKDVVSNLRITLQEIISNVNTLTYFTQVNELQQEETSIKDPVENVQSIPSVSQTITGSNQIEKINDLKYNTMDTNVSIEVVGSLENNNNNIKTEDISDIKVSITATDLSTAKKEAPLIICKTITDTKYANEFDIEIKEKRPVNKETLIKYLSDYISEDMVNVIDKLSPILKLEDVKKSIQTAHHLYNILSSDESENLNFTTEQLKIALLLDNAVSSLCDFPIQEAEDSNVTNHELKNANNVMKELLNNLHAVIESTLTESDLEVLDMDEFKVSISKEPFKFRLLTDDRLSDTKSSKKTSEDAKESISCIKDVETALPTQIETTDDLISCDELSIDMQSIKAEIKIETVKDTSLMSEKNVEFILPNIKQDLQSKDGDIDSIIKLEDVLKEVSDMIDLSCDDNLEPIQNSLDEVQTIIMELKSDFGGTIGDAINETLEDLECNVRSVQLQINEHSPPLLLKEACSNLQVLVAHLSEINDVEKVLRPQTNQITNDILDLCSNDVEQTIDLIQIVSSSENTEKLENVISNLNKIKDTIKFLRSNFLTNAETLIMGGIQINQSLDQIEDNIFCLEKDLESEKNIDVISRDSILSAIHSIYGSISNMRGTVSSVQKKYMYENYGEPSRYLLLSIKNVMVLLKRNENFNWKEFAKSLRKVLNHFEDVKFYINFDKTARLPSDAAFTKIILGELHSVLSGVVLQNASDLDVELSKQTCGAINYINEILKNIEQMTTLEVKEKIPIFKELSKKMFELTENIKLFIENKDKSDYNNVDNNTNLTPITELTTVHEGKVSENVIETDSIQNVPNIEVEGMVSDLLSKMDDNVIEEKLVGTVGTKENVSSIEDNVKTDKLLQEIDNANDLKDQIDHLQSEKTQNISLKSGTEEESSKDIKNVDIISEHEHCDDSKIVKNETSIEINKNSVEIEQETGATEHDKIIDINQEIDKNERLEIEKNVDDIDISSTISENFNNELNQQDIALIDNSKEDVEIKDSEKVNIESLENKTTVEQNEQKVEECKLQEKDEKNAVFTVEKEEITKLMETKDENTKTDSASLFIQDSIVNKDEQTETITNKIEEPEKSHLINMEIQENISIPTDKMVTENISDQNKENSNFDINIKDNKNITNEKDMLVDVQLSENKNSIVDQHNVVSESLKEEEIKSDIKLEKKSEEVIIEEVNQFEQQSIIENKLLEDQKQKSSEIGIRKEMENAMCSINIESSITQPQSVFDPIENKTLEGELQEKTLEEKNNSQEETENKLEKINPENMEYITIPSIPTHEDEFNKNDVSQKEIIDKVGSENSVPNKENIKEEKLQQQEEVQKNKNELQVEKDQEFNDNKECLQHGSVSNIVDRGKQHLEDKESLSYTEEVINNKNVNELPIQINIEEQPKSIKNEDKFEYKEKDDYIDKDKEYLKTEDVVNVEEITKFIGGQEYEKAHIKRTEEQQENKNEEKEIERDLITENKNLRSIEEKTKDCQGLKDKQININKDISDKNEERIKEMNEKIKIETITSVEVIDQVTSPLNILLEIKEHVDIKMVEPLNEIITNLVSVSENIVEIVPNKEDEKRMETTYETYPNVSCISDEICDNNLEIVNVIENDSGISDSKDVGDIFLKNKLKEDYDQIHLEIASQIEQQSVNSESTSDKANIKEEVTIKSESICENLQPEISQECKENNYKIKEIVTEIKEIEENNNLKSQNDIKDDEFNDNDQPARLGQSTSKNKEETTISASKVADGHESDNASQLQKVVTEAQEVLLNIEENQTEICLGLMPETAEDIQTEIGVLKDTAIQIDQNIKEYLGEVKDDVQNIELRVETEKKEKNSKSSKSMEVNILSNVTETSEKEIKLVEQQLTKHNDEDIETHDKKEKYQSIKEELKIQDNKSNENEVILNQLQEERSIEQETIATQKHIKSNEQTQVETLTKEEQNKSNQKKESPNKQLKEKRRSKKSRETAKQTAANNEVKLQEAEDKDLEVNKSQNNKIVKSDENLKLQDSQPMDAKNILVKKDEQPEKQKQDNEGYTTKQNGTKTEDLKENKAETDKLMIERTKKEEEILAGKEAKLKDNLEVQDISGHKDEINKGLILELNNTPTLKEKQKKEKCLFKVDDHEVSGKLENNILLENSHKKESIKECSTSKVKDDRQEIDQRKVYPVIKEHLLTDYESEFSRPPGYIAKPICIEESPSQVEINTKGQTIYKAQTLLRESQLRSSLPPNMDQNLCIEKQSQIKERTKAVSECRSTLSEKRSSSGRDNKRKPVFSTFLTDRTAVEGSRVKLTCSILSPTDPTVTWYKNGKELDNKHKFRSKFVEGLITLEILNAIPSDSGEYSCNIENENGSITSSANLKVYPSFEASPIPPTFTRSIRDNYHLAENELILECRIRGQPLPTITWLKDDKPIVLSDRYQAHYLADGVCRLTISSPNTEDSGKYTCKAENSMWSDQISHDVYFTGKKSRLSPNLATVEKVHFSRHALESRRPHFTNVLSDHKVVSGGTIGLQVEIRGSPIRVEWLREGHSITELYRNAQTYVDHGIYTLALSDVTEQESGLYTCRAYSTQGNVDMNASITVVQPNQYEGKPASIVSRPEKDVLISVGEDLNISFRVQGEPKAKVFFMKGIRDITNSQRVCKMTSDDYVKFTLKRTVVSDAGTYCIFARNAYGCDRAFVTVVIRQRASSDSLISDWTYPMDDLAISSIDRNYKSVPDRIPSEPSAVDGGNNWISLAWPKPDSQSKAPILAYKVESWLLGKEGGARWVELGITPRNSFDAFNLKQGEEYHFRVTPRNRYGWGESVQTSVPIGIGLAGDRPEFMDILPGQLKVLVGETATLSCSFKGKPIPEIMWMKNGHEIEEEVGRVNIAITDYNSSLRIEAVQPDDEGRYSCEATNIHGRSSTYSRMAVITDRQIWQADAKLKRERSAGVDGEYPPQFTMRLRDRRVQATYPVRLTCQVVGNPIPTVKWFKNEEEVFFDGRHTASQDEYFYTLEIAPTTLEDGGVYEAMARNGCGAVSCRCSLVVDKGIRAYIAPEFCCGLEPLYHLSEGDELRISAIVEAYPSVGVTWYRDGVRLRPSRRAIMTLDRDGQIELAVASVTSRDAGVYTCTASNEVGMASTSGKVEIVSGEHVVEKAIAPPIVVTSDAPYSKEPMFIRKPRSSEAREGDTVIIECEVIGDPKPDVYWLRDFLKPDYYRDSSHFKRVGDGPAYRFEIPHAKLDYTGAYSIVARNIHGETKAIISLQILAKDLTCGDDVHNIRFGRVDVIPRFDKELTDLLCYDGDAVEFECSVTGNPDPDIRWFHYKEIVPDCADFESSYEIGIARLKIKQVTAEDEGTYTCEASNSLGKSSSSACLVVYPPGEPNTLSQRLRRPPALLSAASTPRSTPRTTPARSLSRTPGPDPRRFCSPSREIAPKFYTYPYNRVAEEGDTIVFQCAVKGLPPPWATWDKDGIIITPSARISIKEKDEMFRILEIEQVTIEDVGLYRISLENDYGRAEASARLEVITQKGKFYGTRSYSVSPRKTLPYRRRTPSFSKQD